MVTPNVFLQMKSLKTSTPNQKINSRIVVGDVIIRLWVGKNVPPKIVAAHTITQVNPVKALTEGESFFYYDTEGDLIYGGGDYTMKGKGKFRYWNYVKRTLKDVNPEMCNALFP